MVVAEKISCNTQHMRIINYSVELDESRKNILVKENSRNCPVADNLNSPLKVYDMLNFLFKAKLKAEEHMWLIATDTKQNPIGVFELAHGTVNAAVCSPREVFVRLCLCGATAFILAHNHPSGDSSPSGEDILFTKRMAEAGKIINIQLLDHIIIGEFYCSFKEQGLLN